MAKCHDEAERLRIEKKINKYLNEFIYRINTAEERIDDIALKTVNFIARNNEGNNIYELFTDKNK
jgi:hypothetical protein